MRIITVLLVFLLAAPLRADEPKAQRGLAYADSKQERHVLDVYAPVRGTNLPVVVWIHGGGWQRGDKSEVHHKPQAFAGKGFVFVSINYRLLPAVTIQQMAGDVAKAIRWTHDHAKEYGGDPNKLLVMGHSAGAQLAALVCTDDRYLKAEGLPLSVIKGCVPVDGDTYDVMLQIKTVEAKRAAIYRIKFGDEQSQKELSPVTHAAKDKNIPPFLILHVAGHPETQIQSQALVKALQGAGVPARAYPAEGKNHTTINADLGLPDDRPTQEMFTFLDVVLKDDADWIDLFSGKDLQGWKRVALDPDFKLGAKNPWFVDAKNKTLLCDGVDVKEMLLHETPVTDGVFHLEWRMRKVEGKEAGYNSGAYVRSKMDGKVWLQTQIAYLEKPPFVGDVFGDLPQNGTAKRVIIEGSGQKHVKPVGEWNTYDIVCQGPRITVRLNGQVVTEMKNCPWPEGHLGMQAEFFFVEFKNIRFKKS